MPRTRRATATQVHAVRAPDDAAPAARTAVLDDPDHRRAGDPAVHAAGESAIHTAGNPATHEGWQLTLPLGGAVAVLALHGQLPSVAWAFSQALPHARLGYVQSAGPTSPDARSAEVHALCARGLLAGQ